MESEGVLRGPVRAWWTSIVDGRGDQSFPVDGVQLQAQVEADHMLVSGTVPSERERPEIQARVECLNRNGLVKSMIDVSMVPEAGGNPEMIVQTIVSAFETEGQARFAAACLQSLSHLDLFATKLVDPRVSKETEIEAVRRFFTDAFWQDVRQTLAEDHTILIVTVDEQGAYQTRAILDEDARSLRTFVLPPQPIAW